MKIKATSIYDNHTYEHGCTRLDHTIVAGGAPCFGDEPLHNDPRIAPCSQGAAEQSGRWGAGIELFLPGRDDRSNLAEA